ncbi:MAG: aminodeoxychorismate synthase component I [Caldilineales bacterium]|nr:aminodeoxychorismate synthase component I [Caldilineales bacterium]
MAFSLPVVVLRADTEKAWWRFERPVAVLVAHHVRDVIPHLRRAEAAVGAEGLYAVGFVAYEAAPAFDPALTVAPASSAVPLVWLGLFPPPAVLDDLPAADDDFALGEWEPSVAAESYAEAIRQIKTQIALGNTYQVNYTLRLRARFEGDPWALFRRLWQAQPTPYAAYIETDTFAVCSASPELFFRFEDGRVTARPMKGTAPRGRTLAEDEAQAQALRASVKNRAENVMIVDMIRNDLGRVATVGSVEVPHLFTVERYPTLWQMTSTVTAATDVGVTDLFRALFPCASITGAPKVSTMRIIAALEGEPRGVYTGAIGYLAPGEGRVRTRFSVGIRTVVVDKTTGCAEYGVGSGIVWDAETGDEYAECLLKARLLTAEPPAFALLESLLWKPDGGYWLLDRHLQRLSESAVYFAVPLAIEEVQAALTGLAASLPPQPHKVRLLVERDGRVRVEAAPLEPTPGRPLRVALAPEPVDPADPFLYHKTTRRRVYERALAARPGCDDVLLWNTRGELTESTRANLVVCLGGRLYTPPVDCGLLPGTLRAALLDEGVIHERVLTPADLSRSEKVWLINSVRGWMEVEIVTE